MIVWLLGAAALLMLAGAAVAEYIVRRMSRPRPRYRRHP